MILLDNETSRELGQKDLLNNVASVMAPKSHASPSGTSASPPQTTATPPLTSAGTSDVYGTPTQSSSYQAASQQSTSITLPLPQRKARQRLNQEQQVRLFMRIMDHMRSKDVPSAALNDFETLVTESEAGEGDDEYENDGECNEWEDDDDPNLSKLNLEDSEAGKDNVY